MKSTSPGWPEPDRPRARRVVPWLAGALGVVVVAGGATVAGASLLGGGTQPDELIPSSAIGYVRLDADPSLGQKVAAVRFLHNLPDVGDTLSAKDFRESLFRDLKKDNPELAGVRYDRDIKPWLGNRFALGILPPASGQDEPTVVAAVEVTDEDEAREGIDKLSRHSTEPTAVTFRDGYALLTEKGQLDRVVAALDKGSLATNAHFTADVDALGEQGVLSGWVDLTRLDELSADSTPAALEEQVDQLGRAAFALRFDSDYLELAAVERGMKGGTRPSSYYPSHVADLPSDTALALDVSGLDQALRHRWKQLNTSGLGLQGSVRQQVATIESGLGVKLPQDLETLVGKRLLLAAPAQRLTGGVPTLGLRIQTDTAKAEAVLNRLDRHLRRAGMDLPIRHRAKGDELFVATSDRYLKRLSQSGDLGQTRNFRTAVADPGADASFFLNLDSLEGQYLSQIEDKSGRAFAKSLAAIGVSASVEDGGDISVHARLVGD